MMEPEEVGRPMDGHGCRLPFDTDDATFARGFEAGHLWAVLEAAPEEPVEQIVHATNAEMVIRMGESLGRQVHGVEIDGTWMTIFFAPSCVIGGQDL